MAKKPNKTLKDALLGALKVAVEAGSGFTTSYLVAEAYERCTTPEQKRAWESRVQVHHGEVGVGMAVGGAAAKSPFVAGFGVGLAFHDRKDRKKWFTGDKRRLHSRKARL